MGRRENRLLQSGGRLDRRDRSAGCTVRLFRHNTEESRGDNARAGSDERPDRTNQVTSPTKAACTMLSLAIRRSKLATFKPLNFIGYNYGTKTIGSTSP